MAPAATPPASGGGGALGRKVGPLPLGAWIGIGAAVGLVWWLHARATASRAAAVDPGIAAGSTVGGPVLSTPGAPNASGTGAAYADNQAWYQAALNALIGTGYDPLSAAQALANYLAGAPLSAAEQGLVSLALGRTGAPPAPPLSGGGGITPLPPIPAPVTGTTGTGGGGATTTGQNPAVAALAASLLPDAPTAADWSTGLVAPAGWVPTALPDQWRFVGTDKIDLAGFDPNHPDRIPAKTSSGPAIGTLETFARPVTTAPTGPTGVHA